jgi:hypothetical protein
VTGWLDAFCRCTVIVPLNSPVTSVTGTVVKTSFDATAFTVTELLAPLTALQELNTAVTVYVYVPSGTSEFNAGVPDPSVHEVVATRDELLVPQEALVTLLVVSVRVT